MGSKDRLLTPSKHANFLSDSGQRQSMTSTPQSSVLFPHYCFYSIVSDTPRKTKKLMTIEPKPKFKKMQVIELKPRYNTRRKLIEIKPTLEMTSDRPKSKWVVRNEVNKQRDNIRTLLRCSNASPIGRYGGIGFGCCFCVKQYPTPALLKTHTIQHEDFQSIFMEKVLMSNYIVKLDITDLECSLCQMRIDTLETFIDHITSIHKKTFYTDIKSHIIPFKFNNENVITCVICEKTHNNFKVLLEHMNTHFRNYICNTCNAGFVNKRILQTHALRHRIGSYACTFCSKVFNTSIKARAHERAVHITHSMRSKCGYCGEKFSDYTKKRYHEAKVHGAKPVILKCQACDKTFANQRSLTVHTKSFHLMQYRFVK